MGTQLVCVPFTVHFLMGLGKGFQPRKLSPKTPNESGVLRNITLASGFFCRFAERNGLRVTDEPGLCTPHCGETPETSFGPHWKSADGCFPVRSPKSDTRHKEGFGRRKKWPETEQGGWSDMRASMKVLEGKSPQWERTMWRCATCWGQRPCHGGKDPSGR